MARPKAARRATRIKAAPNEEARDSIQTARIIERLQAFIHGKCELAPAQVTACLALLKKTLPDLSTAEHGGETGLRQEDALAQLDGS